MAGHSIGKTNPSYPDAEVATSTVEIVSTTTEDNNHGSSPIECPVCMQDAVYPVQLPCGHIFCFLCIKGVAIRSACCALCRRPIPENYFSQPKVIPQPNVVLRSTTASDVTSESPSPGGSGDASTRKRGNADKTGKSKKHNWYYEGVNGWWQYEERSSFEIEQAYKEKKPHTEVLIAGNLYVINFETMVQFRRNDPGRRRRIKRDLQDDALVKGVAGLKLDDVTSGVPSNVCRVPAANGDHPTGPTSLTDNDSWTSDNRTSDKSDVGAETTTSRSTVNDPTDSEAGDASETITRGSTTVNDPTNSEIGGNASGECDSNDLLAAVSGGDSADSLVGFNVSEVGQIIGNDDAGGDASSQVGENLRG